MKNIGEVCVYEVRKAYRKGRKKRKRKIFLLDLRFAPIETTRSCRSLISSAGFGESTCQQICSSPPISRPRRRAYWYAPLRPRRLNQPHGNFIGHEPAGAGEDEPAICGECGELLALKHGDKGCILRAEHVGRQSLICAEQEP